MPASSLSRSRSSSAARSAVRSRSRRSWEQVLHLGRRLFRGTPGRPDLVLDVQVHEQSVEEIVRKGSELPHLKVGHPELGHVGQLGAEAAYGLSGLESRVLRIVHTSMIAMVASMPPPRMSQVPQPCRRVQLADHLVQSIAHIFSRTYGLIQLPDLGAQAVQITADLDQALRPLPPAWQSSSSFSSIRAFQRPLRPSRPARSFWAA